MVERIQNGVAPQHRAWWKESSVYQIYPASFQDSTGSGTGDLKGIISRVDYLKSLGVDIVWLSPIFESPQVDMGYDISNYKVIDPRYGSIEDVDILKDELHARGMKLVLDLVVNHTSDQHEWFKQSRSSKDNPYRDWYIWKPPKYDAEGNRQPPNNWRSAFQGNAWAYDEQTGEYYLHIFCKEQPDLNWENPAVRAAVHDLIRFWLDRGIDGFRMDVINFISKDQAFPDSENGFGSEFYAAGPRLHEYLKDLGSLLKEYDAFSVGEMPCVNDTKEVIKSVKADRGELNMIFHFELVDLDHGPEGKFSPRNWSLAELKQIVEKWEQFMYANDGWNALYLENHDQPRSVSRFACSCEKHRESSAKMLAIFLGFQAGTPFVYQGQELGMVNVPKDWPIEEYKDIDTLNHWKLVNSRPGIKAEQLTAYKAEYQKKSRDNARTPMQWDNTTHAGFTPSSSTPWMTANPNFKEINATSQVSDVTSVFYCWNTVLKARKTYKDIFVYGDFALVNDENDRVFAYTRAADDGSVCLVVCNFSAQEIAWGGLKQSVKEILVSSRDRSVGDFNSGKFTLGPYEGVAVLLR